MSDKETTPERAEAAEPGAGDSPAPAEADPAEEIVDAEVFENEDAGDVAEGETELEVARRERAEYLELAQRARADFENFKRRASGQAAEAERRGRTTMARGLLPALDNLQRALTAAGVDPEGTPASDGEPLSQEVSARDALAEGVALVYRELRSGLQRAGVHGFDPLGERFDPLQHEAVATGEADEVEPGIVLETLEQGYRIDDDVIRPARVVVSG
jgi:molecular chaperone GrpE